MQKKIQVLTGVVLCANMILFGGCRPTEVITEEPVEKEEPAMFELEYERGELLEVPSGEEVLRALRSDNPEYNRRGITMLRNFVFREDEFPWPSDLRKEDVYEELTRILESDPEEENHFSTAISLVKPDGGLDGYYRTKKDVQRVKDAIERWNATQSESAKSWRKYELKVDEEGQPEWLRTKGGGYAE